MQCKQQQQAFAAFTAQPVFYTLVISMALGGFLRYTEADPPPPPKTQLYSGLGQSSG